MREHRGVRGFSKRILPRSRLRGHFERGSSAQFSRVRAVREFSPTFWTSILPFWIYRAIFSRDISRYPKAASLSQRVNSAFEQSERVDPLKGCSAGGRGTLTYRAVISERKANVARVRCAAVTGQVKPLATNSRVHSFACVHSHQPIHAEYVSQAGATLREMVWLYSSTRSRGKVLRADVRTSEKRGRAYLLRLNSSSTP